MRWIASGLIFCLGLFSLPVRAEPMVGYWRSRTGLLASVSPCGSFLCITLRNKEYAGRMIGKMKGSAGTYNGTIIHPGWNWTFNGFARLQGNTAHISGCVVGHIFCRTQVWQRAARNFTAGR